MYLSIPELDTHGPMQRIENARLSLSPRIEASTEGDAPTVDGTCRHRTRAC